MPCFNLKCIGTYLPEYKLLDGIVVTDVDLIKVYRVVDVVPHVVVVLHMVIKTLQTNIGKSLQSFGTALWYTNITFALRSNS